MPPCSISTLMDCENLTDTVILDPTQTRGPALHKWSFCDSYTLLLESYLGYFLHCFGSYLVSCCQARTPKYEFLWFNKLEMFFVHTVSKLGFHDSKLGLQYIVIEFPSIALIVFKILNSPGSRVTIPNWLPEGQHTFSQLELFDCVQAKESVTLHHCIDSFLVHEEFHLFVTIPYQSVTKHNALRIPVYTHHVCY